MTVVGIGISYGLATLFAMFSGMPIAFALGAVAVVFMGIYMPAASLDTVTENVYEEMASITLLSIPLFILKGAAIGKSRAGQDLYSALHAWLHRVPGGLGVASGHIVEQLYREVRALRIYEGASEVQKLIIAGQVLQAARAGRGDNK